MRGTLFNCMPYSMTSTISDFLASREPLGTRRMTSAARQMSFSVAESSASWMALSTAAGSGPVSSFRSCGEQPSRRRRVDGVARLYEGPSSATPRRHPDELHLDELLDLLDLELLLDDRVVVLAADEGHGGLRAVARRAARL